MNQRPFDTVFIDFYGTISAGDKEAVEAACQGIVEELELSITPHELAVEWGNIFFKISEGSNHDTFRTLYDCENISLKETLLRHGRDIDPVPFVQILDTYWSNPDVYADALEFLRQVDLPVCCISNADNRHIESAIARHGIRFDALITSETVRCYKPEPLIFEKALAKMGAKPERSLHVGDSLHSDVGGAQKMGITAIWLHRENRVHDIGKADADHRVSRLTELLPMIQSPATKKAPLAKPTSGA